MSSDLFNTFILNEFDKQEIVEVSLLTDYVSKGHEDIKVRNVVIEFCTEILKGNDNRLCQYMISAYRILLYKYTRQENSVFGFAYREEEVSKFKLVKSQLNDETDLNIITASDKLILKEQKLDIGYLVAYNKHDECTPIDYIFQVEELEGNIRIDSRYNSNIYKESTIERLAEHFFNIMIQLHSNNKTKVKDIEMISKQEKEQVVYDFNRTKSDYPDTTIHQLFESIARTQKQKPALFYKHKEMSYDELNQRANKLANKLVAQGVRNEEILGIMMDRSLEMIISMIAILKAGGAYMPIDSEYPNDRKRYMLSDSKINILLTKNSVTQVEGYIGKTIYVDANEVLTTEYPDIEKHMYSKNLCYIIYTSGSTGNPKGVMIEHKNVIRLVKNTNYIKFVQSDRMLQAAAAVFDAATFEIWGALLNGLSLYIIDKEDSLSAKKLGDTIKENQITILWLTSALFNQITEQNADIYKPLRCLLVGGDVLSVKYINKVKKLHSHLIVINGYGPTENTTFSTCHIIDNFYEKNIPIGKCVSNTTAYILDGGNNPQPIGVPGELCFGGSGVGRGYLNNEELTKKRFVHSPFTQQDIIYYTGDLARWFDDGTIEFLGRIDSQVKIRGYRIELGEIENQLLQHKAIKEAAVIVKEDSDKNKLLCAYITSDREMVVNELREYLGGKLPAYMLPAYFMQLEKIPLNTSGKIDKKALPNPQGKMKIGTEYIAPRNDTESTIAHIWQEVLGVHKVGIQDKFFDLGGDSLMATKICALAEENNILIGITDIFTKETIENIFNKIENYEEEVNQFTLVQNRYNLKDYKNINVNKGVDAISEYEVDEYLSKKELKIVEQKEITTYLHRSLPLCALLAYESYRPWYYCNYIQVFSYKDESGFIELNYLEPRDSFNEVADVICLGYHLLKNESDIVKFVKEKINLGYYLIVNLDEYELHNKKDYLKNHFVHPSIIYGYNDSNHKMKAIGFDKSRLFTKLEFSYDELSKSYESSKIHYINYAPWCAWSAVQLIKPKSPNHLFPFNINKFLRDLGSYINAESDNYRLYTFEYPEDKVKYGLDVYDVLVDSMREVLLGKFTIDYRALHLLSEHKKCLYDRISYIIESYQLDDDIRRNNELFMELVEDFNAIRLKYLGQAFVNFDINKLTKEQKQMIKEVTEEIEALKDKEFFILERIYKRLKDQFSNDSI